VMLGEALYSRKGIWRYVPLLRTRRNGNKIDD
jgi:hypothetical protein